MRILLITNLYPYNKDLDKDTNTKALHNIVKNWDHNIDVIRPFFFPTEHSFFKKKGFFQSDKTSVDDVTVHKLPIRKIPKTDKYFYRPLINYVRKENLIPDVIISHRLHCIQGSYQLAVIMNKPLILGIHASDISALRNKRKRKYYRRIISYAERIACRSASIYKEFINIYPEFKNKCFIAFSGISESLINNLKANNSKHKEWFESTRPIKFITVANLIKLKNVDINLKALAMLSDELDWQYTIVGDGDEMTNLKNLTAKLGLENKVFFVGKRKRAEVFNYLEESDIFIMVSAPETFGLVYLEAMAKGCIVLGAYENGIDGIISDGTNGFLCRPRLENEVFEKINLIVNMPFKEIIEINKQSHTTIFEHTESVAAENYFKKVKSVLEVKQ